MDANLFRKSSGKVRPVDAVEWKVGIDFRFNNTKKSYFYKAQIEVEELY